MGTQSDPGITRRTSTWVTERDFIQHIQRFWIDNRTILLKRLSETFGIKDNALLMIQTYLKDRYQKVKINNLVIVHTSSRNVL